MGTASTMHKKLAQTNESIVVCTRKGLPDWRYFLLNRRFIRKAKVSPEKEIVAAPQISKALQANKWMFMSTKKMKATPAMIALASPLRFGTSWWMFTSNRGSSLGAWLHDIMIVGSADPISRS